MSYFNSATMAISEIGAHGDYELPANEFDHDDRRKRISSAASGQCDFVYEYLLENGMFSGCSNFTTNNIQFKREHLSTIARMAAVGMMAQFEQDLEMEIMHSQKLELRKHTKE
jgi:hypothetical protein